MKAFLRRLVPSLGHLSDETLSRMINDELGSLGVRRAEAHLASCWQCRARSEQLETAALQVVGYRKARFGLTLPHDRMCCRSFLNEMGKGVSEAPSFPWRRKVGFYLAPPSRGN